MTVCSSNLLPSQPLLKWAGGKRWLVPHLEDVWEGHEGRRLVEPFCGGLAVALGLRPEQALLNDVNSHLINFYKQIKVGLQITIEMKNEEKFYYKQRDRFNQLIATGKAHSSEGAQLFFYLNRTGYNGLCRFNRRGKFNVPFGRYNKINYERDFASYGRLFRQWQFTSLDFQKLVLQETDFIYADPPYDVQFTQYAPDDFNWEDQVRLAKWLSQHPGPVVLSNQATERILELYKSFGFKIELLEAPRRIACTGDRTPALEVVATRNID